MFPVKVVVFHVPQINKKSIFITKKQVITTIAEKVDDAIADQ